MCKKNMENSSVWTKMIVSIATEPVRNNGDSILRLLSNNCYFLELPIELGFSSSPALHYSKIISYIPKDSWTRTLSVSANNRGK